MSEAQRRPQMPPIEAHPEPPLSKGPLLDQLHQEASKGNVKRREVILAGIGAVASALGIREVVRNISSGSNKTEASALNEVARGPQVQFAGRDENGNYFLSDVAEYIDLNEFEYRQLFNKQGSPDGMEAPIIHEYDPKEGFGDAPERSIDINTQLGENVKLVRLAIDAESGANFRVRIDPANPEKDIPIWLGFAKENPNDPTHPIWTDEHGTILTDTVDVVSPIFTDTHDPKRD